MQFRCKQIFLIQFNQKFLHPISDCDSSTVHLNSLMIWKNSFVIVYDESLTTGIFCQLFTAHDFENSGTVASLQEAQLAATLKLK